MKRRFSLFCSTNEKAPIRLVDIVELFFREMRERGVEQRWSCHGSQVGPWRTEIIEGVPVFVSPVFSPRIPLAKVWGRLAYWGCDILSLLRLLVRPVDVIQVRDKYLSAVVGLAVARLRGRLFTVWLSYPFPESTLERAASATGAKKIYDWISGQMGMLLLYRVAMRYADHCFVQSEQMKLDLQEFHGVDPARMTPVPMGITRRIIDRPFDADARRRALLEAGPDRRQTVMYLGTLDRLRRLDVMVDAFIEVAKVRERAHFLIVGDGIEPLDRQILEDRVREAGLNERFTFTGFVPLEQAWQHLETADVAVSPFQTSRVLRVASPTKLVEYLAFGVPTVANDHPEHSRVLAASGGGVCVPWSVKGFADGVLQLLDDPQAGLEMGREGREWVLANRTYDRIADDVYATYLSLLEQPR